MVIWESGVPESLIWWLATFSGQVVGGLFSIVKVSLKLESYLHIVGHFLVI